MKNLMNKVLCALIITTAVGVTTQSKAVPVFVATCYTYAVKGCAIAESAMWLGAIGSALYGVAEVVAPEQTKECTKWVTGIPSKIANTLSIDISGLTWETIGPKAWHVAKRVGPIAILGAIELYKKLKK